MTAPSTRQPLLDVTGLRVTYGGVVAVSDVDLQLAEGTIYGLIGPNGAGKTSMVDALTGYTRPAAGLDTAESLELGRRLRTLPAEHGVTIFLIDHDMGLVLGVCDHVMVLDFGRRIADGTPAEIRDNQRVIEAYLGGHHAGTGT